MMSKTQNRQIVEPQCSCKYQCGLTWRSHPVLRSCRFQSDLGCELGYHSWFASSSNFLEMWPEEYWWVQTGHRLQFILTPTPRWPDGMCIYDPANQLLLTNKLFRCSIISIVPLSLCCPPASIIAVTCSFDSHSQGRFLPTLLLLKKGQNFDSNVFF